jgi:hypothetical protein
MAFDRIGGGNWGLQPQWGGNWAYYRYYKLSPVCRLVVAAIRCGISVYHQPATVLPPVGVVVSATMEIVDV